MLEVIGAMILLFFAIIVFGIAFLILKGLFIAFEFLFDTTISGCLGCIGYFIFAFFVIGCLLAII